MSLMKITMVFVVLSTSLCCGNLIEVSEPDNVHDLVQATVKILSSCYTEKKNGIGLVGDLPEELVTTLYRETIPVMLYDDTRRNLDNNRISLNDMSSRIRVFVLTASSWQAFRRKYVQVFGSIHGANTAHFLVLEWSPKMKYRCSHEAITEMLYRSSLNKISNTKVLCANYAQRIVIYAGHNFHGNRVPYPWKSIETHQNQTSKNFTFLQREYGKGDGICEHLDFDKMT